MDLSPATDESMATGRSWPQRVRLAVGAFLIWALLQFLLNATFTAPGLARPATLAASNHPVLAELGLAIIVLVGSLVAARIAGPAYPQRGLLVAAVGLALWVIPAGTVTDWLTLSNPQVGAPTGRPYWPLVIEYFWLLVLMLGVAALTELSIGDLGRKSIAQQFRRTVCWDEDRAARTNGVLALLLATLITGALMLVLTGPVTAGQTLRGQVYFAVALSSACGAFVAYRVVHVTNPIWFWPAPILAGLIGVLVAAIRPTAMLPAEYAHLNSIPAWGLARALPIEMVSVGVAASLWALRTSQRAAKAQRA